MLRAIPAFAGSTSFTRRVRQYMRFLPQTLRCRGRPFAAQYRVYAGRSLARHLQQMM
jgi:hypothetical protein